MKIIGRRELAPSANQTVVKDNIGYWVWVEWNIGGLKQKWRQLMQ